jgi:cytidine deaminase
MKQFEIKSTIKEYSSLSELSADDQELIAKAHLAANDAYAPYSKFYVGAAIRLENDEICVGNNQENAAYPSGICAERVAVFSASATHPNMKVKKIAVVAHSNEIKIDKPISPCGACRQVLAEYESKSGNIILLLMGETGNIYEISSVKDILPLMFTAGDLGVK